MIRAPAFFAFDQNESPNEITDKCIDSVLLCRMRFDSQKESITNRWLLGDGESLVLRDEVPVQKNGER